MILKRIKLGLVACLFAIQVIGQYSDHDLAFFEPADTFNSSRFYTALAGSSVIVTGFSIALYNTWYTQYEQESFHFFNDWGEWNNLDKVGHIYTAYLQSVLCYKGAKWTGLSEGKSILTGAICGSLFQSTVEVFDGFSSKWGFSLSDFGANALGVGSFVAQQKAWGTQRILIKESVSTRSHSKMPIYSENGLLSSSLFNRSSDLFGSSTAERLLKDYNNQTYWLSFSPASFQHNSKWPEWLNIAMGYGSENLFGGFENTWIVGDETFILDSRVYPRYKQFYLSLDVDLTKIKTDNHFLKTLFSFFNIVKVPAPALEVNTTGEVIFHFLHF
jgi:hypothetical protein